MEQNRRLTCDVLNDIPVDGGRRHFCRIAKAAGTQLQALMVIDAKDRSTEPFTGRQAEVNTEGLRIRRRKEKTQ